MTRRDPIRDFYVDNPRMVSSPFGGVDGVDGALLRSVLARLDIDLEDRDVLDVGCGRGYAGEVVRAAGGQYTGLDFVASRGGVPLVLGDAACLPFPDACFDVAFCIDASEHFPAPERAAREVRRVLRPGGVFFLSAPNYGNVAGLVKKACEWTGACGRDTWAPFGRWTPQEYERALTPWSVRRVYRAAGFGRVRAVGHAREVGLGLFPWVDHPRMPEAVRFRLQRLFNTLGPAAVRLWPGSSLHLFWRMDV